MKKFFIVATALMLFVGCAYANQAAEDGGGATAAPPEINHADSIYFPQINFYELTSNDGRIILTHYPTFLQTTEYSCGPASALTVLHWFGNNNFDEMTLVKLMKTDNHVGTSVSKMSNFFREIGWEVHDNLDTPHFEDVEGFQKFVLKNLSEGTPIMVENVEYGGHWRVIVGCDTLGTENLYDDVLIFADPYDTSDHNSDGFTVGSLDRFFSMWFDHALLPENEREQPWLTAHPKK
ncbi:MAG: C39 family peptidase [Selenomonadaceae bacterium]|nr:C39 family peptidase [Selenomonadaceae bacterium]